MNNLFLRIARAFRSSAPESQESASEVPGRHANPAELGMNSDKPQKEGRGQRLRGLSLRAKLPFTVISLLVFAFIIATFLSVGAARNALTNNLEGNLIAQTTSQAELLRSHLIWTRGMAIDLAANAEVTTFNEEGILSTIRQTLSRNEQIFGSTIAYEPYQFEPDKYYWSPYYSRTSDNNIQFTQLGNPDYNYFQWDWYTLPKKENAPVLSPPYYDEGGGNIWMVTWSVPFYNEAGSFMGVATTDISFQQTQDIVRQITVGREGYAFLIDRQGTLLGIGEHGGAYKIMEDSITTRYTQQTADWGKMAEAMSAGESGFANVTDLQGKSMFVAYQPIGLDTGWSLGLAFPQDELFQPAIQLQNTLIFYSILVTVLASVFLFFFTRSITLPIQRLASQAKLFSQGQAQLSDIQNEPIRINTHDELEDLGDAFNQMVGELAIAFQNIEQRVTNRTRDMATVAAISTKTAAILDPYQMLATAVHLTQRGFNLYHTHVFIYRKENDDLQIVACGYKEGDEHEGTHGTAIIPLQQEQSLVARSGRTQMPVIVNDVRSDPNWLPNPLLPDSHAELAVPMIVGNELLGVLDVQADHVDAFTEEDANIQMTLAAQIATALKNAQSYDEAKKRAELETLVNTIGQKIQRATTVDDTLQTAIREIGLALGASRVSANIGAGRQDGGDSASHS